MRRRCNAPRRGVALFTALWLVVAIGIVGLQFSLEARERRLAAANTVEFAQSRASANAGVDHAQARLERLGRQLPLPGTAAAALRSQDPWLDVDTLVQIDGEVGGARYQVRVRDVGSALNLNRASADQLQLLMTRLGFDFGTSEQIAQCIADWRDEDVMHRSRGAEREDYVAEKRLILPRDGPFQDLPELLHVLHMTPEIYDSIAPFLMIDGTVPINVNSAPPAVLATLPRMSDAGIASIMRLRGAGRRITSLAQLQTIIGSGGPALTARQATVDTRSILVTSTGWNAGGRTPVQIDAVIDRITNTPLPTTRVQSRRIR
jgi:general secretion pathway protein K